MQVKPLQDRLLVERAAEESKTAGGIIIPDNTGEKPAQGTVVAVGPGLKNDAGEYVALDVKVGDRIIFGKYSGTEVKVEGKEFLIMNESDVLGTFVQ